MNGKTPGLGIEEIYFAAVNHEDRAARAAYLDQACGLDSELRRHVERLLDARSERGSFLQSHALGPTVEFSAGPIAEGPGTVIGPYKLLEPIGEGGMGIVYMAEQTQPMRRKVALKIIKPGMDTKQVIARFDAERQALALMDHPNIARVLDAGATESGRPYFVMELVNGIPITDYCDRNRVPIEDRLALFVQVCQAVQHAHQKGIIHRDLKPSNVLVTMIDGAAVPKIIDFGVAKATGQQLTEKTLFTGFTQLIGTPLYMSPEQAEFAGVDVDTRSDIYALGVLLYELLTGTTPFDQDTFRRAAIDEVRRIIREQDPPKPSTRISTMEATATAVSANRRSDPRSLGKLVRGELDWIVMKALDKDRSRRYETANALADDLKRFLNQEPVEAGPPSTWYRLRKTARRNRAALVTAALVAVALVAGTVVSTWQAIRAVRAERLAGIRLNAERAALLEVTHERNRADVARNEADRRATEAREVVDFLVNDLIGAASPSKDLGTIPTAEQVLARADEGMAKKFADRPLIEASIRHALGKAYEELGQYPKAEQHARRAVQLRLAQLGPEHADTIAAQNALGWAFYREGKTAECRALLTPVLATARQALGPEHHESLRTMHVLAPALPYVDAQALGEEELAIRKRRLGADHPQTLSVMNDLAVSFAKSGNFERAISLYEHVLTVQLRDQPHHPDTLITLNKLADVHHLLGRHDRAADIKRRVMEGRIRVLGLAHPLTADTIWSYYDSARRDRAHCNEARKTLEPLLDQSRRELGQEADLTITLTGWLAATVGRLGQTEKATALVDALPVNHQARRAREELACALSETNPDAAVVQFQRLEALRPGLIPADDPFGLVVRTRLALALRERGRFAEAWPLLEQTLAEALQLGKAAPTLRLGIEEPRGLAQLLLRHWPGLAPGISPAERPPASFTIDAPFRAKSTVADGRIAPDEYGPAIEATFDGNANPGRLWAWGTSRSKTPHDLSVRIRTAYTDQSLFLAFQVRDQLVCAGELNAATPHLNDSVVVYLNGDHVANDHMRFLGNADIDLGNREGFQLTADARGHQYTIATDFTNADWKVGTSRTPDGYIIEFEIPLALIDTRDGKEYVPATSGSEILVNFVVSDCDDPQIQESNFGIFWAEDPNITPYLGGEDFWTVSLRLVPKPASSP
jgi:serine/threonine protein kinase/tetratricopeptide (TPR) repeat protein